MPPVTVSVTCSVAPPASSVTEIALPKADDSSSGVSSGVVWLPGTVITGAALLVSGVTVISITSRSTSAPPAPLSPRSLAVTSIVAGPA